MSVLVGLGSGNWVGVFFFFLVHCSFVSCLQRLVFLGHMYLHIAIIVIK